MLQPTRYGWLRQPSQAAELKYELVRTYVAVGPQLESLDGRERRLGDLPDPPFPRRARDPVRLIDRPNERPWGAGEPAAAVVRSAIANAVYDAVGIRLRSVPFTPDKVFAALKTA